MKFGAVTSLEGIDLSLPHGDLKLKAKPKSKVAFVARVGLPKWNRNDVKSFYPPGVRDELPYYSTQFNSIELNATFFQIFPKATFKKWYDATPPDFIFFPKIGSEISHARRLRDFEEIVDETVTAYANLKEKLGIAFLQMHDKYRPVAEDSANEFLDRLAGFIEYWTAKSDISLAVEARNTEWHIDPYSKPYYDLLEKHKVTNIITDSPGRRDVLHMRPTTPTAYVRFVGANHPTDYSRLDEWVEQIATWKDQGLQELDFIIHEFKPQSAVELSRHFIEKLNSRTGTDLPVPKLVAARIREDGALFG